jgi:hypothetical protein
MGQIGLTGGIAMETPHKDDGDAGGQDENEEWNHKGCDEHDPVRVGDPEQLAMHQHIRQYPFTPGHGNRVV